MLGLPGEGFLRAGNISLKSPNIFFAKDIGFFVTRDIVSFMLAALPEGRGSSFQVQAVSEYRRLISTSSASRTMILEAMIISLSKSCVLNKKKIFSWLVGLCCCFCDMAKSVSLFRDGGGRAVPGQISSLSALFQSIFSKVPMPGSPSHRRTPWVTPCLLRSCWRWRMLREPADFTTRGWVRPSPWQIMQ